jgi:hypothetical protein
MAQIIGVDNSFFKSIYQATGTDDGIGNDPAGAFAGFLNQAMDSKKATATGSTVPQDISVAVRNIAEKLTGLIQSVSEMMDRMAKKIQLSLPDGYELRQSFSTARVEVIGVTQQKETLEKALNKDAFFCQAFQAIRLNYSALNVYQVVPTATREFSLSITFKSGTGKLTAQDLSGSLLDKLMEELDGKGRAGQTPAHPHLRPDHMTSPKQSALVC